MDFSEIYFEELIVNLAKSEKYLFCLVNSFSAIILSNFKVTNNKLKGFMKASGKKTNFTAENGISSQNLFGMVPLFINK